MLIVAEAPPMYEFVDRDVSQQQEGVRLLVWGMRRWVGAAREGRCICRFLVSIFQTAGAPKAAEPLANAMRILVNNISTPVRFGAIDHPTILEHEAVLLGALRTAAAGRIDECQAIARLLVHADMAPALASSLVRLAEVLNEADVHLAAQDEAAGPGGSGRP